MISSPTPAMLRAMLRLQEGMNRKINEHWLDANYAYLRAVLVEAVEGLDHYGWKWWKAQTPDMAQLRMELIDIWHFLMSHYLVGCRGDIDGVTRAIVSEWQSASVVTLDGRDFDLDTCDLRVLLELLAGLSAVQRTSMPLMARLFGHAGLDGEGLFREYVSKNVLNHFRQDNGYKTGTYHKTWGGQEDNVHLVELMDELTRQGVAADDLPTGLYQGLQARYQQLTRSG